MSYFKLTPKSLAIAVAGLLPATQATPLSQSASSIFKREPPAKAGACATYGDMKWQPVLDFDTDGCYNTPAIGGDGTLNEGMDNCYTTGESGCRDEVDLDNNNVYSRARCNNGWCAHIYGYYFEKDVALENVCGVGAGHRHDWEHVVVWVQDDVAQFVAASAHGEYDVRSVGDVLWEGDHPKIVYHKDGAGTHALRFAASEDDAIENHKGVWFLGDLVGYLGFPSEEIRESMLGADWGSATIDFGDARFQTALDLAKGGNDIPLDTGVDDETSPGVPEC